MTVPTGGGGGTGPPGFPTDPCNSPPCTTSKADLNTARADYTSTCSRLDRITSILRFLAIIVKIPIWIIIVLVIVAVLLWLFGFGLLAVLLWAIIFIYAIAFFLGIVFGRVAASMAQQLADLLTRIRQDIANVIAACPATCQGDLSIPTCNVQLP